VGHTLVVTIELELILLRNWVDRN